MSGILTEVNTRVDILVLGYFHGDTLVGVYSFAAILAEGFSQLPMVVRRSIDPLRKPIIGVPLVSTAVTAR